MREVRVVRVIGAVRAQAKKGVETGERDFSQSCLDCHKKHLWAVRVVRSVVRTDRLIRAVVRGVWVVRVVRAVRAQAS